MLCEAGLVLEVPRPVENNTLFPCVDAVDVVVPTLVGDHALAGLDDASHRSGATARAELLRVSLCHFEARQAVRTLPLPASSGTST